MPSQYENLEPIKDIFGHCRTWREVDAVYQAIMNELRRKRIENLEAGDEVEAAFITRRIHALELHLVHFSLSARQEDVKQ